MQGLITLDFGNTNPHAGLFHKNQNEWQLIKTVPFKELNLFLSQLQMNPNNSAMVLAEVKAREDELTTYIEQGFLLTRVKQYWRGNKFAGMPVNYATTLGEDRLIEAFYVYKKLKENVLLIDAGTFTTMDVVTTAGFQGGYIIPGLNNYLELFQKGEQLTTVELDQNLTSTLPQTTAHAMRDSYVAFAALAKTLLSEHKIQKILLTGGQSEKWGQIFGDLPASVVVQSEPDLIHWALQFWMTTQIEPL